MAKFPRFTNLSSFLEEAYAATGIPKDRLLFYIGICVGSGVYDIPE